MQKYKNDDKTDSDLPPIVETESAYSSTSSLKAGLFYLEEEIEKSKHEAIIGSGFGNVSNPNFLAFKYIDIYKGKHHKKVDLEN